MLLVCSIYTLELKKYQSAPVPFVDSEGSPLLDADGDADSVFRRALDYELEKICLFYKDKEAEMYGELDIILKELQAHDASQHAADHDHDQQDGMAASRTLSRGGRSRQGSVLQSSKPGRKRQASILSRSFATFGDEDSDDDDAGEEEDEYETHQRPPWPSARGPTSDRTSTPSALPVS